MGSIIRTKSGEDMRVTGKPRFDKFYCRKLDDEQFKVVYLDEIAFVHPTTATLPFEENAVN